MTAREADHVGNQPVFVVQRLISFMIDRGMTMPAEGLQRLLDKLLGLRRGERPFRFVQGNQLQTAGGEDIAPGKDRRRLFAQGDVINQIEAQHRGEDPKRIAAQSGIVNRTKRGRVDRHPGLREVVIADREHAHNGEHPPQGGQLQGRTDTDRPVAFEVEASQFIRVGQLLMQLRVIFQYRQIHIRDQLQQRPVLRNFLLIHCRHRL
ncbi:hypothetical protein D3C76_1192090 [compost metagenome]